jgi:hypothetical protein
MNTTIERFKTAIEGHLRKCSNSLKYIREEINDIKNEDDALYVFKQRTKETYKLIWLQKCYKDILMRLEDIVDIEEINYEIANIEKCLLCQSPMKSSTSQINNLFSLYEFECLQEVYHVLSTVYQSITKNKN